MRQCNICRVMFEGNSITCPECWDRKQGGSWP